MLHIAYTMSLRCTSPTWILFLLLILLSFSIAEKGSTYWNWDVRAASLLRIIITSALLYSDQFITNKQLYGVHELWASHLLGIDSKWGIHTFLIAHINRLPAYFLDRYFFKRFFESTLIFLPFQCKFRMHKITNCCRALVYNDPQAVWGHTEETKKRMPYARTILYCQKIKSLLPEPF